MIFNLSTSNGKLKSKGAILLILVISIAIVCCNVQENDSENYDLSDVNHIIHMGQSLGAGEQSLPIVTDINTGFGNFKFEIGTHTWSNDYYPDKPELRDFKNFSFVPLIAQQRGAEGETIANGMCDHLSHTIQDITHGKNSFLFSYAGQGGRFIRELDKRHDDAKDERAGKRRSGGGYYVTSVDDVKRAKTTADSLQLSYAVFAISWMQGESESGLNINRWDTALSRQETIETYKNDLIQVKKDYQNDINSITGQGKNIPFFTYQTFGAIAGTAQLLACDQERDMFMVAPTYMLPNAENGFYSSGDKLFHGDGIHLTADGERWLGEQFGKVMRKVIIEEEEWQPLRPLKAWHDKNENAVFVRFYVPEPPLVIDTTFLPSQDKGLGFSVYDASSQNYDIEKVNVVGNNLVQISLVDTIPLSATLMVSYGLLSKVSNISRPVKSIRSNVIGNDGHESIDIVFDGNILEEVAILRNEGVFYLDNIVQESEEFTNLIIRESFLDNNGNSVFRGESDDLRNNVNFKPGQNCFTSRRFTFGNIRDSDTEKSTFYFEDNSYGDRCGQDYPLYNWCIAFQDLQVKY